MKREVLKWPVIYALVVCTAYAGDYAFYIFLTQVGANIYAANLAAAVTGCFATVLLLRKFSHAAPRFPLSTDFALSLLSNGLVVLAGLGLFWVLVEVADINHYLAKLIANGTTFLVNFLTRTHLFTAS